MSALAAPWLCVAARLHGEPILDARRVTREQQPDQRLGDVLATGIVTIGPRRLAAMR
jgi:hypothetical protein